MDKRKALTLPRYSQVGREAMSYEELQLAIKKTGEAYKAGRLSKSELAVEVGNLKRWEDALKAEAAAQGKPISPAQPEQGGSTPDYGKGLREKAGKGGEDGKPKDGGAKEAPAKAEPQKRSDVQPQRLFKRIVKDKDGNLLGIVEEPLGDNEPMNAGVV